MILAEATLWGNWVETWVFVFVDPGIRVEDTVADVLKQIAVIVVATGFKRGVDHSSGGIPELRGIGSGLHAKFLDSVRRRLYHLHGQFLKIL